MACRVNMNIKKEYYPTLTNLYGKNGDVLDIRPSVRCVGSGRMLIYRWIALKYLVCWQEQYEEY